ncbi:hypothetical protein AURDEDRAFT_156569 [Auricularia subglabra TFB-10046 SS5]|nr:hypothetical protein AURDEDRAFT_156569 [Auricularia subglabra TFB-10046 SS5]
MALLSSVLSLSLLSALVSAQQTAVLADDKRLKYDAGNWKTGSPCAYGDDGKLVGGQPGCFNLGPDACAASFQYTNDPGATVALSFKGTGIVLTTLSQPAGLPTNVTITLDGQDSAYTSEVATASPIACPLAFQSGDLNKDAEHTITVKITEGGAGDRPFLGIHSFTIVTGDAPEDNATETTTGADGGPTSTAPPNAAGASTRAGFAAVFAAFIAFIAFA